eukprot:5502204-Pyramimonas_sp.AAC.1
MPTARVQELVQLYWRQGVRPHVPRRRMILTLPPVLVPERHPLVTQGLGGLIPIQREVDLVDGGRKLTAAV